MNDVETYENISRGWKVSRKDKLAWIGRKLNKSRIRRRLINAKKEVKVNDEKSLESLNFCYKCGCHSTYAIDHEVGYPEIWVEYFCLRCHTLVMYADNSPYTSMLHDVDIKTLKLIR